MTDSEALKPTVAERQFLNLAYNAFYDICDEVGTDSFWDKEDYYRLSKIKDAFGIYSEILEYEPVKWALGEHKKRRPPSEGLLAEKYFLFVRNLLMHFPFFSSWDSIWFDKALINWSKPARTIDKFMVSQQGKEEIKYRMWNPSKKKMTYVAIRFPAKYSENEKVYLKDLLPEKTGFLFSIILMRSILDTQVEP